MVILYPYVQGDLYEIDMRAGDDIGDEVREHPGPSWTLKDEGEVLACFGICNIYGGVGTAWAFVSDKARHHGASLPKAMIAKLKECFDVMKFHRLQTVVRPDMKEYLRFVELIGFEREGLMRKATPRKQDVLLYSMVN